MDDRRVIGTLAAAALCALALFPTPSLGARESLVPPDERITDAEARLDLARLLSLTDAGRDEALDILQKQLRLSPRDEPTRLALAEALVRAGRLPEAERVVDALPAKMLALPETQQRIGDAFFAAGRMSQAAEHLAKALAGGRPVSRQLAQALAWSGDSKRARPMLEKLAAANPNDDEVAMLLVRLRLADGDGRGARELAERLLRSSPENPLTLAELADVEAALGHAARTRELYARAVALPGGAQLAARRSQAGLAWGAFDQAVVFGRDRVVRGETSARLPLARAYIGAQRDAEAEGVLRSMLSEGADSPDSLAARLDLARLKLDGREPAAALAALAPLLSDKELHELPRPLAREALTLAARALSEQGDPLRGLALLSSLPSDAEPALRARLLLAAGRPSEAQAALRKAHADEPADPEISFLLLGDGAVAEKTLAALTAAGARSPEELTAWAELYAAKGWREAAIRCLRAALAVDKEFFPARMRLVEVLAASRRYPEALARLDTLAAEFPDSSKVLLTRARVLSWDKRYDEAQAAYAQLAQKYPSDPVPVREAARVHFWAKEPSPALAGYARLTAWPAGTTEAEPRAADRIRRTAELEARAKDESFNNRFTRALPLYGELLDLEPGNQEARFDQGQAACALGLCSRERAAYTRLLEIDPLHTLAGTALERLDRRTSPALTLRENVWHEVGHGDVAGILRLRTDVGVVLPIADDFRLGLTQHRWEESPRGSQSYEAVGQTLSFNGVFSPELRGEASWTNKRYTMGDLNNVDTGRIKLIYNVRDLARLGFGYERMEELVNQFAVRKQSLSDNLFAEVSILPTRDWEIAAEARGKNYSDGNIGDMQKLSIGYSITDHPRQLRVILSGERRNTDEKSQDVYAGAQLVDIRRPYWTPRDYTSASLTLEWRHDLSDLQFCGAPQNYYVLRAATGTDSDNNPSAHFEAEWKYEFAKRWSVEVKGLVHRSPKWDADGLWGGLGLEF